MNESTATLPPAGWYPDPSGSYPGVLQYWDGTRWTGAVSYPVTQTQPRRRSVVGTTLLVLLTVFVIAPVLVFFVASVLAAL